MFTGYVDWFDWNRGFGFISPFGGGPKIFVSRSEVERAGLHDFKEGMMVSYDEVWGDRGLRAVDLRSD